ncbi:transcriptional regulator ATRX homolog [Haliotis rubra]|uniref:transcriptional regulator ATRX homolog n=1 Tax=Haliotis rubra TaxID=36100 RepID=UPI001EE573C7|nr:transcriptional regulator ATRX homolog [Haliotis rubra]
MHKLSEFGNKETKVEPPVQSETFSFDKHSSQEEDSDKDLVPPKAKKPKKKKKKKDGKGKDSKMEIDDHPTVNNTEKREPLSSSFGQKSSRLDAPDISELAKKTYNFDASQDSILEKFECKPFGESKKKDGPLFSKNKLKSPNNDNKSKDILKDFNKDVPKDIHKDVSAKESVSDLVTAAVKEPVVDHASVDSKFHEFDITLSPEPLPDINDTPIPVEIQVSTEIESPEVDIGFNNKAETKKSKKGTKKEKGPKTDKPKKTKKKDKEKHVSENLIEKPIEKPTSEPVEKKEAEPKPKIPVEIKPDIVEPKAKEVVKHHSPRAIDSSPDLMKVFDILASPPRENEDPVSPPVEVKKSPFSFQSPKKETIVEHDEFTFEDSNDAPEPFPKKSLDPDWTKRFKPTFEEAKSADDSPRSLEEMDPKKLVIHFPEEKDDTETQEDLTIHLGIPNTASLPKIPSSMAEGTPSTDAPSFPSLQSSQSISSITMVSPEHHEPEDTYPSYTDITNDEKAAQAASDEAALAVASILFEDLDSGSAFKTDVPDISLQPADEHLEEPVLNEKDRLSDLKEAEAAIAHIQGTDMSPQHVGKVDLEPTPSEKTGSPPASSTSEGRGTCNTNRKAG